MDSSWGVTIKVNWYYSGAPTRDPTPSSLHIPKHTRFPPPPPDPISIPKPTHLHPLDPISTPKPTRFHPLDPISTPKSTHLHPLDPISTPNPTRFHPLDPISTPKPTHLHPLDPISTPNPTHLHPISTPKPTRFHPLDPISTPKPTRFHPLDQIVPINLIPFVVTKCRYVIPVTRVLSEVKKVLLSMSCYIFILTHTILRVVKYYSCRYYVPMCSYTGVTYYVHI